MSEYIQGGIFYQLHGKLDADLPALVLVHGLFGNSDNLSVIRRAFEDERMVISIDLPNHGKSMRTEHFDFEECAQLLADLLTSIEAKRFVLVGHSLGGKVCMLLAKKLKQSVERLVVMDIAPVPYAARHHNVFNGLANVDLNTISSRTDAKNALAEHVKDPGTQAFLLKSLYQNEQGAWQWRFNLYLISKDYDALSAWPYSGLCFDGPTLFMKGSESDYIKAEHQNTIIEQFPQASAKIVQAGHWLHAQKPQVVSALIAKFIK